MTDSLCPQHVGFCAYTGTEPDRCGGCHAHYTAIERRVDYEGSHDLHLRRHEESWAKDNIKALKVRNARKSVANRPHSGGPIKCATVESIRHPQNGSQRPVQLTGPVGLQTIPADVHKDLLLALSAQDDAMVVTS